MSSSERERVKPETNSKGSAVVPRFVQARSHWQSQFNKRFMITTCTKVA